jgi:DNA-directed RNA polymerase subunit RPC12/RpoP
MTVSTLTPTTVQCPKCGHHTIVEYKPTVYRCLKCDFEKDFSTKPKQEEPGGLALLSGIVSFLLTLALIL